MATIGRIRSRARPWHGIVTLEQLRGLGCTRGAIRHLVRTERIWRVYPGVYAADHPLSPAGWALAAVRACEPRAYASHLTAAALLSLSDHWPERPQVTIVGRSGARGPRGIEVHHARRLADVRTCHGIPTTGPARTVADCAPFLEAQALKRLLRNAEYHGLDLGDLAAGRLPRDLRALLDRYVIGSGLTASELEVRFLELCAAHRLPPPAIQARFPDRRRVDFAWHPQRLIVETDGRRAHDSFIAFADDRARDRAHLRSGYATLRFTWWEVEREPGAVAAEVAAALSR